MGFDAACALQFVIFWEWNLVYPTVEFPTPLIYSLLIYHSLCAGLRFFCSQYKERLVIWFLHDFQPPIIEMISSWGRALSLAILTLNVTRIVAINWGSLGSDIENGVDGVVSSVEGAASQLIGDLESDFQDFESAVESELSKALVDSNGTLAQFTMGYQTYVMTPIAPTIEILLMLKTEHHR